MNLRELIEILDDDSVLFTNSHSSGLYHNYTVKDIKRNPIFGGVNLLDLEIKNADLIEKNFYVTLKHRKIKNKKIRSKETMGSEKFESICKNLVAKYFNDHVERTDGFRISDKDVYIVWSCKTLQNNKALASTNVFDGMYYEITYNGDKEEVYLDAYKKWENKAIPVSELI